MPGKKQIKTFYGCSVCGASQEGTVRPESPYPIVEFWRRSKAGPSGGNAPLKSSSAPPPTLPCGEPYCRDRLWNEQTGEAPKMCFKSHISNAAPAQTDENRRRTV